MKAAGLRFPRVAAQCSDVLRHERRFYIGTDLMLTLCRPRLYDGR